MPHPGRLAQRSTVQLLPFTLPGTRFTPTVNIIHAWLHLTSIAPWAILPHKLAEVAEWQTRRSQKPLGATPCGFDSRLRHQLARRDGAWLSLVERSVRVAEVGGSNPL